jgi:Staygreen protein
MSAVPKRSHERRNNRCPAGSIEDAMSRLIPTKLHVRYVGQPTSKQLVLPRRYTLTHSDATGDLYLTIGADYDRRQISGLYTRLMRDEVLAEWRRDADAVALHVYCHVSGGLVFGSAAMRDAIFRRELPLVLEAFRYGDRTLIEGIPELDRSPIWVHFLASTARYHRVERWGTPADYQIEVGHASR